MDIRSWIRAGFLSVSAAVLLIGCGEFDRKACESNWECRQHFGVGSTCDQAEGFCKVVEIPEGCGDGSGLNYPPDIFLSPSARETISLGMIVDGEGQQVARATRLAMEMANIKGGISDVGELARYKFSAVVCDLAQLSNVNSANVGNIARFLRDDVGAHAVVLGVNSETLKWATDVLSVRDGLVSEPSQVLMVSANSGSFHTDAQMRALPNLWTLAASEDEMFRRTGEQLALRRLQPYARELHAALPEGDTPTVEELAVLAYEAYAADNDAGSGSFDDTFVVNTIALAGDSAQSGTERYADRRRDAIEEGLVRAFGVLKEASQSTSSVNVSVRYAERLLECGENCTTSDIQPALTHVLLCKGGATPEDGEKCNGTVLTESFRTETDAIILHTESRTLLDTFLVTLLSDEKLFEAAISVAVSGKPSPGEVNTAFFLPALASAGTTAIYAQDWSAEQGSSEISFVNPVRWVKYVQHGRFLGVRQAADKSSMPYVEFETAGNILLDQGIGIANYYFAQAYDSIWMAMAAITARTIAFDPYIEASEAVALLHSSGFFSQVIRTRFSGATIEELEAAGVELGESAEEQEEDLIPSRWQELFQTVRSNAIAGHHKIYRFRGSSGEARFANPDFQVGETPPVSEQPYGGRERVSYDYSIWSMSTKSKAVDTPGEAVDISHCIPGIIAPRGLSLTPSESNDAKNQFICPVEVKVCRQTFNGPTDVNSLCIATFDF